MFTFEYFNVCVWGDNKPCMGINLQSNWWNFNELVIIQLKQVPLSKTGIKESEFNSVSIISYFFKTNLNPFERNNDIK